MYVGGRRKTRFCGILKDRLKIFKDRFCPSRHLKNIGCMSEPERPTPLLSLLKVTQRLWRRLEPCRGGGRYSSSRKTEGVYNVLPWVYPCSFVFKPTGSRVAAWRWKGRLDLKRYG